MDCVSEIADVSLCVCGVSSYTTHTHIHTHTTASTTVSFSITPFVRKKVVMEKGTE